MTRPAAIGDVYRFVYEDEPQFNRTLTVIRVTGVRDDSYVFFDDGTHAKQKDLKEVERVK